MNQRNRIVEERLANPLVNSPVLLWDAAHGALAPEYLLRSHIYFKLASSHRPEMCRQILRLRKYTSWHLARISELGEHFAVGTEHAAAANGGENERQLELGAQESSSSRRRGDRHRPARAERQPVVRPHIVAERHFRVGAAVDVVEEPRAEDCVWRFAEVADVEDVRRATLCAVEGILSQRLTHLLPNQLLNS